MKTEILMAVYNGEKFLAEQIESILQQDTQDWHLTISDDGSSDESIRIIEDYIKRFPEKIGRVFSERKFGNARDHFFWLMKSCKADYMLFCDQDDVWHSDKVRKTVEALKTAEAEVGEKTPLLVFTDQTVVDETLKPIAPSLMKLQKQNPYVQDYRSFLIENVVTGCTVGINRALADIASRCAAPEKTIMHDWWLGLVAACFGKMVFLDESTMEYRQHGDNSVGAKDIRKLSYILDKLINQSYLNKKMHEKKLQAEVFLNTYDDLMPADKNLLSAFTQERIRFADKLNFLKYVSSALRKVDFLYRW